MLVSMSNEVHKEILKEELKKDLTQIFGGASKDA
jgi:hypothetical protein